MKRGTSDHPKIDELCSALAVPRYAAVGILNTLWDWASRYVPRGDIGKYSDTVIAKKIDWDEDPTALIAALLKSKWLDASKECRLTIHDWAHHCEDSTHSQLAKQGLLFADGSKPKTTRLTEKERKLSEEMYARAEALKRAQESAPERPTLPLTNPLTKPEPEGARRAQQPPPIVERTYEVETEDIAPEGLAPVQYATGLLERCELPVVFGNQQAAAAAIEAYAKKHQAPLHKATVSLIELARAAIDRGETVDRWWFEDGKYNEGKTNAANKKLNSVVTSTQAAIARIRGVDGGQAGRDGSPPRRNP